MHSQTPQISAKEGLRCFFGIDIAQHCAFTVKSTVLRD